MSKNKNEMLWVFHHPEISKILKMNLVTVSINIKKLFKIFCLRPVNNLSYELHKTTYYEELREEINDMIETGIFNFVF